MASRFMMVAKAVDKRIWWMQTPLRQFHNVGPEILFKLEDFDLTLDRLQDMEAKV